MTKRNKSLPDFATTLSKLEEIVNKLESPQTSLENSLILFEEGISLARSCETHLKAAEHKVQILIQQKDGSVQSKDFNQDEQEL